MRIIFFGTPEFAATSLKQIHNAGFQIVGVVTAADKPAGRGQKLRASAVKVAAEELGLPISQPSNLKSELFQQQLRDWNPDLGVVIAFRMLPEKVWNFPSLGTVNLHASLLPHYRGAAPIQHAIINGEVETGVSTFFLKHAIDTGDIIDQMTVKIGSDMNAGELHDVLMINGAKLMVETLNKISQNGKNTPVIPQQNKGLSDKLAPKITREFCKLDLFQPAENISNKIRGLSPYPGAWIETKWGDMKIFQTEKHNFNHTLEPGVHINDNHLVLACKDGLLKIKSLQIPGKSKMETRDFLNGFSKKN